MKTIQLPCFSIVIDLGDEDLEHPGHYLGGNLLASDLQRQCSPGSELLDEEDVAADEAGIAAAHALESMILAHAIAGIDVTSPAYCEGIETAVEAIANNL